MAKAATYDLKKLMQQVRPITGGEDGLASLVFSKYGRLYSYYRNVLISAPVPEGFPEFVVKADSLVKASTAATALSVSATRLTLNSGKVKTWLQLDTESMLPEITPKTDFVQVPEGLVAVLKEMAKLVPSEAPRIWSTSLLLKGQYAYATDGSYIVRKRLNVQLPFTCALPHSLITVLAKLNKPLATMAFDGFNLYVTFADGSRLSSPVYAESWPDVSDFFMAEELEPVNPELLEFLEQVKPYAKDEVVVEFTTPNLATFRLPDTEAQAAFTDGWVKQNFATSLSSLVKFVDKGAMITFTERFAVVKYEEQTVIIAAKLRN